jgi:hypothetical protein
MHGIALWLALAVAPFWETKAPRDWSEEQLLAMMTHSPWAQPLASGGVYAFLATAGPMQEAEREMWRRRTAKGAEPPDPEYVDFLEKDQGKHIVLAVSYRDAHALANAGESRRLEEESILRVGKKKYKITGQFPPTPRDPYLRLVYPREVGPNDMSLVFELYLPGTSMSYQMVEFRMKELLYHGKPEM